MVESAIVFLATSVEWDRGWMDLFACESKLTEVGVVAESHSLLTMICCYADAHSTIGRTYDRSVLYTCKIRSTSFTGDLFVSRH